MLTLNAVHKSRGAGSQRYSLVIPRLHLRGGEQLAVVGPSGCGKSTLLDLLALVLAPDQAGQFDFTPADKPLDIAKLWRASQQGTLAELRSRYLGYVLQTGGLLGFLDVRGNIALSRKLLGLKDDASVTRLAGQLDIADQLDKKPADLSVGQRQRVSCARALAHGPRLLLADEPTAALDPLNAERVMQLLVAQAREHGVCCVVATHDEALARASVFAGAAHQLPSRCRRRCHRHPRGGLLMRGALVASLAWQDYRNDAWLSACSVLALVAVVAPLLVLFGLKFGLVSSLTERLQNDPATREIIPLGGGRFSAEFVEQLSQRSDVAFALPRTRQIAATADLSGDASVVTVEMIPTAASDPLFDHLPVPQGLDQVVLSQTAAEKLGAKAGDWLQASFGRQVAGRSEAQRTRVQVLHVLPLEAFARDGLFAPLALLEAAEDYRDGRAVPAFGWPGDVAGVAGQRVYPAFRLYARSLGDVEPLRQYFAGQNLLVSTQAQTIAQVQSLSRNLSIVFWIIAGLALAGAFAAIFAGALAAVERKRRELSVLRLLGVSTAALLLFVVLQALYSATFAALLSAGLYGLAQSGLNYLFAQMPGEYASHLLVRHYTLALVAVLGVSAVAAACGGWRVARIQACEGIRDV